MADRFVTHDELLASLEDRTFDRPPAIVCNAHITGLGVARALDAHDVPVIAVDRNGDGVAPYSNAVTAAGAVTYPLEDPDGFVSDIEAIAAVLDHDPVAFPCMDEWVFGFATTEPAGVKLPFSSLDVIDAVLDKGTLYERADALGIPIPETHRLDGIDPEEVAERLGYPFVVKPALKRDLEEAIGTNVVEVTNREEFDAILDAGETHDIRLLAQEAVAIAPGEDRSLASYVPPSGVEDALSIVGNARVRSPPAFGTSCLVQAVEDDALTERALSILDATGYHGISEAEFVYDEQRDTYVLLDVNTRPWKWISLPVSLGANLPYAAYADAIGESFDPTVGTDGTWVSLLDYGTALTSHGIDDRLGDREWRALASGAFESQSTLTTAIHRPSDPGPLVQALRTRFSNREYYCSC